MDEPKGGQGDPTALTGGEGTTPTEPETYTKEQADKLVNDALSMAGRDAKSLETTRQSLAEMQKGIEAAQAEIQQWKENQDKAFLEANKDNPDAIDWYQKKQELQRQITEFNKLKLQYDGDIQAAKDTKFEVITWKVAGANKVDPTKLKELAVKLNLTTEEQIDTLAKNLKAEGGGDGGDGKLLPVTSVARGASKDVSSMSADEKLKEGFKRLDKK